MTKRNLIHAIALSSSSSNNNINWVISVQPKTIHKWFSSHKPPTHIFTSNGKTDLHPSAMMLKVLIGENDLPHIEHCVQEALGSLHTSDADADILLQSALSQLQNADVITHFDIPAFTITVTKTLLQEGEQEQHSGPLEIDHEGHSIRRASAGLEESMAALRHKEKKSGMGFWVSTGPNAYVGNARRHVQRNSWERQDDAYGGLM